MKNSITTLFILLSISLLAQTEKVHQLNIEESVINWKGTYTFKFSQHEGTVHFKKGHLITNNGNIIGGSFIIDMTTITNEDYENNIGAVGHLRDSDFFDVTLFPEAKLKITSIEYFKNGNVHEVKADLTIKGITKSIEFWANVNGQNKTFESKFKIDRSRWGIIYNHKLKDKAISEAIEFYTTLHF